MSLWTKLIDSAGGSLVTGLVDGIKAYFPPSMSDQEKAALELNISTLAHKQELSLLEATNHMEAEFNQRIKDMEGTASDLKTIKVVGPLIIFFRGLQRPLWGFGTAYMDYMVFAGDWTIVQDTKQDLAFFVINLLVLGFLFGERALKNVGPIIERMIKK